MGRTFFRLLLGGITGKILGILREGLLAALFGVGKVVGANRIALSATMIPINFFTADALSAGFLPLYVQYRQDRPEMALALYRSVRTLLASFSVALVVALLLGRDLWVGLLGPGLDDDTAGIAVSMLGVAALGVPFYVLFSLYTLVALSRDDVRLINLRASLQSIGLILATLAAYFTGHVTLLAWGFTVPYVALWAWGFFYTKRKGYLNEGIVGELPVSQRSHYRLAMSMFWRRLRPLLLIPVILQGSIGVERAVGSLLGVDVVAATDYSRFVVDSCMALIAAPLGLAGLTAFARMRADEVVDGLKRLIPPVLLVTVPLSLIICVNSRGIISLVYARGKFDEQAVDVASIMLLGFALGIWAQVLGYTFVKVLNARGANFRVAIVSALSFGVAAAMNLALYREWGPFTIGAAASVGGLILFVASALSLNILRYSTGLLAALLPGVVAAGAAGYLIAGPGLLRLIASCTVMALVWILYVTAVPPLRRIFVASIWAKVRNFRKPAPVEDPAAAMTQEIPRITSGANEY